MRRGLDGKKLPFQDNSKHQINFALWYQDSHFQARVAYNYRTPRLSGTFQPGTTFCTGTGEDRKSTSELQSLMRISYAVFCLKKKNQTHQNTEISTLLPHHEVETAPDDKINI